MKTLKITATLVLLLCTLITMAAKPTGYTINGLFTGLPDGTVLEMIPSGTHDDEKAIATATLNAGKFSFNGKVESPRLFQITVKGHYGGCQVMVDNTNIKLSAQAKTEENNRGKFLNLEGLKVIGSPIHEEYLKKVAYREMLNEAHIAYNKRGEAIMKEIGAARSVKDTIKLKELMDSEAYKKFEAEEKAFFNKVEVTSTELIEANKNSWWGPFLMLNAYSYFTPDQKPMFEMFSKMARESYYGKKVKDELLPEGFLNQKAPMVSAATSDKVDADLMKLLKGHKYTLVDFWASWCVPCRKSIPALKALYEAENKNGLQIVSISIDKKESDWLKAEKEEQLKWPSVLDKGETANAWKVRAIPAMFLLDENGRVIGENLTLDQIKEKLD